MAKTNTPVEVPAKGHFRSGSSARGIKTLQEGYALPTTTNRIRRAWEQCRKHAYTNSEKAFVAAFDEAFRALGSSDGIRPSFSKYPNLYDAHHVAQRKLIEAENERICASHIARHVADGIRALGAKAVFDAISGPKRGLSDPLLYHTDKRGMAFFTGEIDDYKYPHHVKLSGGVRMRFVGYSDELVPLRHQGWFTEGGDWQETTLRGCVLMLPGGRVYEGYVENTSGYVKVLARVYVTGLGREYEAFCNSAKDYHIVEEAAFSADDEARMDAQAMVDDWHDRDQKRKDAFEELPNAFVLEEKGKTNVYVKDTLSVKGFKDGFPEICALVAAGAEMIYFGEYSLYDVPAAAFEQYAPDHTNWEG